MSCWRRTTVLRIPAIRLGFINRQEWNEFLGKHEEDFNWEPGFFASALCDCYEWDDSDEPERVPGPFLDYYLDEIIPLLPEENSYHENDCVRELTQVEKEKYLPLFRELFPDFTMEKMKDVHYCQYEWYDGTEAPYNY